MCQWAVKCDIFCGRLKVDAKGLKLTDKIIYPNLLFGG